MEQDDEDSQGRKRCKVESVTLNEAQLSPMTSNDTIHSRSINGNCSNSDGKEQSEHQANTPHCVHCQTEHTPQWRSGPLGPKTLCNACGVQFRKFGRLIPEYQPGTQRPLKYPNVSHKNAEKTKPREPELRAHQPAEGLGFRALPHSGHSFDLLLRENLDNSHSDPCALNPNSFNVVKMKPREPELRADHPAEGLGFRACAVSPNSFNIDISKFLKPNAIRTDIDQGKIISPIFMKMLTEGVHADITFKAHGGSVKAHRCVLASASPVFAAMFKDHEKQDHEVKEVSIDCWKLFLVLLYITNEYESVPVPEFEAAVDQHLVELLKACQKYDVNCRLKSILIIGLYRNLSPENCWQFWNTTGTSDSPPGSFPPAVVCYKYILENFDKILESRNVLSEMKRNPELVVCFMKAYVSRNQERSR